MIDRAFILEKVPEIAWIRDEKLRNLCLDTWLYAAEFADVDETDLEQKTIHPEPLGTAIFRCVF